ncbi:MAG TPA: efflux RND transporter periplasmic adaptor subunit, partial [Thermoanaerobaculia bacterium]|nr:efflux RND transporter periplasmic adaptor subunit [Thermoanaerobaculia bacterium]
MTDERPSLDSLRIHRGPEDAHRPRRWPWVAAAVLLVLAAAGAWWALAAGRLPRVATAPVAEVRGGAPAVLNASGYVTARRRATVSSKVTGKIVEVLVEEGMAVEEGQVLARLDDSTQRAALQLGRASLQAARGALAETEARLAKARLDRARAERLVAEAVAPQDQLDSAATEVDALAARLALEGERVEVAAREVALQEIAVADMVIRAPFSGVAISKNAQPGEIISPVSAGGGFTRTGVSTIVDMSSLEIEVDVGESYIQRVHPGQRVEATLDAYPGSPIPAHVITTIPAADREKATVTVRIGFDGLDPRILPDMGVKVSFLTEGAAAAAPDEPRSRLLIPRAAVRRGEAGEGGGQRVWVVEEGRVAARAVELGARAGDRVQVLSGLEAGERVVVESSEELEEG